MLARLDSGVAEDMVKGDMGDTGGSPTEGMSKEGSLGRESLPRLVFVGVAHVGK